MEYIIEDDIKQRLDKYLIDKLDLSRSKVQEMIEKELVLVNNKKSKNSYLLRINDSVKIVGELKYETFIKPQNISLDIVFEDDYLMVINKASNMVVHPSFGHYSDTLVNALLYYTNNLSNNNGNLRPGIVHRLDKDTSGLMIVAKNDKVHDLLAKQLKDKTLKRKYIALVHGIISHDYGTIDAPIGRDEKDRKKMCVTSKNSKEAITEFKVLERYKNTTLIECNLKTGRTHQIRVHLSYINHPVVNDPVYSSKKCSSFGQMLHSYEISFIHPITNEVMTFKRDVPKEFKDILEKYKNE